MSETHHADDQRSNRVRLRPRKDAAGAGVGRVEISQRSFCLRKRCLGVDMVRLEVERASQHLLRVGIRAPSVQRDAERDERGRAVRLERSPRGRSASSAAGMSPACSSATPSMCWYGPTVGQICTSDSSVRIAGVIARAVRETCARALRTSSEFGAIERACRSDSSAAVRVAVPHLRPRRLHEGSHVDCGRYPSVLHFFNAAAESGVVLT